MGELAILYEWAMFAARWLHVVTAIAWIGSSFYFIALDLGLRKTPSLPPLAHGEEWQVHGGGFYHIQKYLVAPEFLPEHLTWFKWESYWTWFSGLMLMALIYYVGADLYLIDRNVLDVPAWVAIGLSIGSIVLGWVLYDSLCKSPIGNSTTGLMLVLFAILVGMSWGYTQLFTGRAAMLHMGAFTATIMAANVAMIIIPNQKIVVGDLKAGRVPDAKYGKVAKQRSLHNNYLTLPVIFFMLSSHYPLAFATQWNWIIASLIFLVGVVIRHYFNTRHARKGNPHWTWPVAVILFIIIAWLSSGPKLPGSAGEEVASRAAEPFLAASHFAAASLTVQTRCAMCHTAEPAWPGVYQAPRNVVLDNDIAIANHAKDIAIQAGFAHAMPPGNVSEMTPDERALIVEWFREGSGP
ncbi:MAG: urate hydroxylase PuuD [Alphaproteobacteria bacterium]|nr:urate hydroxylase PuuD [Alphaproteobacteria bacterium]MBU1560543.1 urate hydroxylase PuuD [Alphaproteobacteria bacterium]MBU2301369.1 urate hydroxylase PuuD [Alphaproteobacteria bacterium]MBU2367322.1 urate hydroxylase PuuD [Alphaproteobacteria bacterium]